MEPKKRQLTKRGKEIWEVDFGADDQGIRRRPTFKDETDADAAIKAYKKAVKDGGEYWGRLTIPERKSVVAVMEEIDLWNSKAGVDPAQQKDKLTVRKVWEDWQAWRKDNKQSVVESMPYAEVVKEWARRKLAAGKSKRYVHDACGTVLNKFGEGRGKQPIHEISAPELERWINARCILQPGETAPKPEPDEDVPERTWGLSSKKTNISLFHGLWEVAIAKEWASVNIVDKLEPVSRPGRIVKIYPNSDTMNLMAGAMENAVTQTMVGSLSLGFFGCMRPEEIQSKKAIDAELPKEKYFGWHDIDLDHGRITVRVEIAKTGDQRTIRLQPCAVEWLKLAKELGNEFPPYNEQKIVDQICEMIGLQEWLRDGLRKNCATHLRAVYKNDYDVVKDCGNSVRILLKHYADLHTPEVVSKEHWEITPEKVKKYRETADWHELLVEASRIKEERIKQEIAEREKEAEAEKSKLKGKVKVGKAAKGPKAAKAVEEHQGQSASETETSAG